MLAFSVCILAVHILTEWFREQLSKLHSTRLRVRCKLPLLTVADATISTSQGFESYVVYATLFWFDSAQFIFELCRCASDQSSG